MYGAMIGSFVHLLLLLQPAYVCKFISLSTVVLGRDGHGIYLASSLYASFFFNSQNF